MGMGAPPVAVTTDDPSDLRARLGAKKAAHLLRSTDADERLRGLERAASLDTPETVALLIQQIGLVCPDEGDPRAKIAIARGLAGHVDQPAARAALLLLVGLPTPRPTPERAEADEPSYAPRMELARRIAALALAESGEVHAVEALVAIAANGRASMSPSPGAAAAMAALEAYPPGGSATWAKAMSAGMARLVALTGDLRTTDALLDAAKGTDTTARVAAIEALGALGDPRVLEESRPACSITTTRASASRRRRRSSCSEPPAHRAPWRRSSRTTRPPDMGSSWRRERTGRGS